MSDRALNYLDQDMRHRVLVICEGDGFKSDKLDYAVRALLSEGCLIHQTVVDGLPVTKKVEGPTGLITTTTGHLHLENETRMLSLHVAATEDQSRAVLEAMVRQGSSGVRTEIGPWHDFQATLEQETPAVYLPFAEELAKLVDVSELRIRRDFEHVLTLIKAHAWLHQVNRKRSKKGRVIASFHDYEAVYMLVEEVLRGGNQAISPAQTKVLEAVSRLTTGNIGVSGRQIADDLGLAQSQISRHLKELRALGRVQRSSNKVGVTAGWLPVSAPRRQVLPTPEELGAAYREARKNGGVS